MLDDKQSFPIAFSPFIKRILLFLLYIVVNPNESNLNFINHHLFRPITPTLKKLRNWIVVFARVSDSNLYWY